MKQPAQLVRLSAVAVAISGLLLFSGSSVLAQLDTSPVKSMATPEATTSQEVLPVVIATPTSESVAPPAVNLGQTANVQDSISQLNAQGVKLVAMPARYGDTAQEKLLLTPGKTAQFTVSVNNSSDQPVTVKSLTEDFIVEADSTTPTAVATTEADNRWSMSNWITLTPTLQTIKPNATANVDVQIEVPEDALPGGRYVMIMHEVQTGANTNSGNTNLINQRVGTLVYGLVDGPYMESAFIRSLTAPAFLEYGPVPYSFRVDNDSDVHIQPQLTAKIYNLWGKEIDSLAIEARNIFPKNSLEFTSEWNRIWGLGRYKLEIAMIYGTAGSNTILASTYFWLIPVKLLLAVLIGFITIIAMVILIRLHYLHRKNDQAKRVAELEQKIAKLEEEKQGK